jgi:hypothetical protein
MESKIMQLPDDILRKILNEYVVHPLALIVKNIDFEKEFNKMYLKTKNHFNVFGYYYEHDNIFISSFINRQSWYVCYFEFNHKLQHWMTKKEICKYLRYNKIKYNRRKRYLKRDLIKLALSF